MKSKYKYPHEMAMETGQTCFLSGDVVVKPKQDTRQNTYFIDMYVV